jgi:hypothetical protein
MRLMLQALVGAWVAVVALYLAAMLGLTVRDGLRTRKVKASPAAEDQQGDREPGKAGRHDRSRQGREEEASLGA